MADAMDSLKNYASDSDNEKEYSKDELDALRAKGDDESYTLNPDTGKYYSSTGNKAYGDFLSGLEQNPKMLQDYSKFGPDYQQFTQRAGLTGLVPGQVNPPQQGSGGILAGQGQAQPKKDLSQEGGELLDLVRSLNAKDPEGLAKHLIEKSTDVTPEESLASSYDEATGEPDEKMEQATQVAKAGQPQQNTLQFGSNELGSVAGLQQAQQQARRVKLANQIGRAGEYIAAGVGGAMGSPTSQVHPEVLKEFQAGENGANDVVNSYMQQVSMQKEDPNSSYSQGFKDYLRRFGVHVEGDFTAAEGEKLLPTLFKEYEAQQQAKAKDALMDKVLSSKEKIAGQKAETQQSIAETKADQGVTSKQSQALQQTQQMLESARGNREVTQAQYDRYQASKAIKLIDKYDPNNLSPQQVNLVISEVAKIATGGVPTQGERASLSPNTWTGKLAKAWSEVSNNPTSARAGAFIKQYRDYLQDLQSNANSVIQDKFGRVIESKKDVLGDKNYQTLKEQYIGPLDQQASSGGSAKTVVKKGYNASTDQTQLIYSDGTKEIVSGRQ